MPKPGYKQTEMHKAKILAALLKSRKECTSCKRVLVNNQTCHYCTPKPHKVCVGCLNLMPWYKVRFCSDQCQLVTYKTKV